MSWFKKKEDEGLLPDLPEPVLAMPSLPDAKGMSSVPPAPNVGFSQLDMKSNSLPAIPGQQDAIKHELDGQMHQSNFEPMPVAGDVGSLGKIVAEPSHMVEEHHDMGVHGMGEGMHHAIGEPPKPMEMGSMKDVRTKKAEPIYIRLDKFKAGLESFEEIKDKIIEIEELLAGIKEVKEKEDRDLEEWEREIHIIKSRIETIDRDVFNKLD